MKFSQKGIHPQHLIGQVVCKNIKYIYMDLHTSSNKMYPAPEKSCAVLQWTSNW